MKSLFTMFAGLFLMNTAMAGDVARSFEKIDCEGQNFVWFSAILDPTPYANTYFEMIGAKFQDNFDSADMICQGAGSDSGFSCVGLGVLGDVKKAEVKKTGDGKVSVTLTARRGPVTLSCTQTPCSLSIHNAQTPWRDFSCQ